MLPDGSVPTLQQLAAALVTGSAIQDQPGNIIPPGGGPSVLWQNIQFVPASVVYPPRFVQQEEDAGEDYYRMAVPGPIGVRGLQGFSGVFADDPEDPVTVPGPVGAIGPSGAASVVHLWPEDTEDPLSIPGAPGSPGAAGIAGALSTIHLYPDDPEDPGLIPGAPGVAGVAGPTGAASTVHLWPDDPEDPIHFMGDKGNVGATGPPGSAGASWAAYLDQDAYEDQLQALRALPNNVRFQSVIVDGQSAGVNFKYIGDGVTMAYQTDPSGIGFMGTTSNHPFRITTGNSSRIVISAIGAVTVVAPTSAATALNVLGVSGGDCADFTAANVASNAFGVLITAGTNVNDYALFVRDVTGATVWLKIDGSGQFSYGGLTAATASNTVGGPALPALAKGFMNWVIGGANVKIPYYAA